MKPRGTKTSILNSLRLIFRNRFAESLLIRFTRNKMWNDFAPRIPANHYQYPKGSVRKVTRNGFHFVLDISDYMQWTIYFGVLVEPREVLYNLIKPGMHIMDVGANIGETALEFSRLTGSQGVIYAFEPDNVTLQKLNHHIQMNHATNIKVLNYALGDTPGQFTLGRNEFNSGGNSITTGIGVTITVRTADEFIRENNISKIDFIKIDVEGYESQVLKGAGQLIQHFKPIIFAEVVDEFLQNQGTSARQMLTQLTEFGYSLTDAYTGKTIDISRDFSNTHFDVIARPSV
jgi:FkbM family methyltransferase